MQRKEVNVVTGEVKIIDLTPEEIAEIQSRPVPVIPYDQKRRVELAQLDGEGMDAIRREIAAIRAGQPETIEYATYRAKVSAIKTKYPKPQEN